MFNCTQVLNFADCLISYMKVHHEEGDDEEVANNGFDGNVEQVVPDFYAETDSNKEKKSLFSSKRTQNKDQIVSFFRNALARNYKLKSNIKTTRF